MAALHEVLKCPACGSTRFYLSRRILSYEKFSLRKSGELYLEEEEPDRCDELELWCNEDGKPGCGGRGISLDTLIRMLNLDAAHAEELKSLG